MKRIFTILSTIVVSLSAMAQTPQQIQQLQKLTPMEIEQMKKGSQMQTTAPKEDVVSVRENVIISSDVNKSVSDSIKLVDKTKMIYGHDLFNKQNLTFAPSMNLPTPSNYILGSGDELNINLWGAAEATYAVAVSPDGYVNISGVGLIQVKGLSIKEADKRIKSQLAQRYEGASEGEININISLGKIRTISVNIAGEAKVPGTYSLPSLATLFNALYVAGGVSEIGSVRQINLFRSGKKVNTLDVYDYLINGDTGVNVRLEDNDLIVIEPYISIVNMVGAVKRPMKYEMKSGESLESLINYSGGFNGEALVGNVAVSRSADGKQMRLFTVDKPGYPYFHMMDNDHVVVNNVSKRFANKLTVTGEVWEAGNYELKKGISTVKQLVEQAGGVTPHAFGGRALLFRLNDDGTREVEAVNITDLMSDGAGDVALRANDSLVVYSQEIFNQRRTVIVRGEVNNPATISYGTGMTVRDAIIASGGFTLSASHAIMEVSRRVTDPNATQVPDNVANIFTFKVDGDLSLSVGAEKFLLMPFDEIFVRRSPGYVPQMNVTIEGEVVFDGQYTMETRITRIADIIKRAGGVTRDAYVKGAFLKRLKTRYDVERERSLSVLQQNTNSNDTLISDRSGIGSYYSVAVDLETALKDNSSSSNIELKDGDFIVVPILSNTVKISGAVYYPNTVTYRSDLKLKDYIESAGGYSDRARKKPFVIYPNGMVVKRGKVIEPGSEIVIPFKPQRDPMKAGEWISLSSSVVSMAAMVTSLFR